jgi:hypothetical protein
LWRLLINPTVTGAFTAVSVPNSAIEYDITRCKIHGKSPELYIRWKTEKLPITSFTDTVSRLDAGWCSDCARIVPFQEETIQFLIVYRKDKLKK